MNKYLVGLALFSALGASAQTVTASGSIQLNVTAADGGSYSITVPVSSASLIYTPPPPPPVSAITSVAVSCAPTAMLTNATAQCSATVAGTGSFSSAVTWYGANSTGSVSSANPGTMTVTAVSVQDISKSGLATVTISAPASNGAPVIPSTAKSVELTSATNWKACVHDTGTPGSATCSGSYPVTDAVSGSSTARSFSMTYTGAGGVRWADDFANDTAATNYVLETLVSAPDWSKVANLELDTNQTKANGHTTILGTQCSSYSKTWEITITNSSGSWSWTPTNVPCNPLTWTPNVLHHIRIFGSISTSEVSTYLGVELDGVYTAFTNAPNMTGRALSWAIGSNLTNFQIDGLGASGSATIYADKLTEYRW